ncbi:hypothetical protein GCM10023115_00720 [Pontixanthobacter gangjinensis]|uniref:Lipoprotein n=1 Tax=Pontixanthobacter gangjinensis TaxID=1028742 RepID=A0A6I4SKL9_9SPHN|nr:hypothetical protein [Pontixanthobacter gangjinensis]MXO55327.1 hypothetical protein [Pontixanthobacter gangjinensis]
MKKILIIAAVASLAACSAEKKADETATPAETVEVATETTAADGGPSIGTFKVTDAEGKVSIEELRADGTYTSTSEGEEPKTGKWEQKSPESFCSTPDAEESKQTCYAETVGEDGVWTSTDPDDGSVSTVERVVT